MPQVQVLPEVPSFGSQLAQVLSQAGTNIGEGLIERQKMNQLNDILSKYSSPTQSQAGDGTMAGDVMQQGAPQGQQGGFNAMAISSDPAAMSAIAQINPQLANTIYHAGQAQAEQERINLTKQKMAQQQTMAKDKRAYESNKPFMENIGKLRNEIPNREVNMIRLNNVLESNDLNTLRNFAAETLGDKYPAEFLMSKSANELKAVVKDEFVDTLKQLPSGARLNQFIEKNVYAALQSPLKDKKNNLLITEAQKFKLNLDKKKLEVTDKLLDKYEAENKEPPANFDRIVDAKLKDYTNKELTALENNFKKILSGKKPGQQLKNTTQMIVNGTVYNIPNNQLKDFKKDFPEAKKHGS